MIRGDKNRFDGAFALPRMWTASDFKFWVVAHFEEIPIVLDKYVAILALRFIGLALYFVLRDQRAQAVVLEALNT